MSWYRTKRMSADQLADFQAKYAHLYAALRDNSDMAVLAHNHSDGDTTVLIPFARSGLVEAMSPGDWFDQKTTGGLKWRFLAGCSGARIATELVGDRNVIGQSEPASRVGALV